MRNCPKCGTSMSENSSICSSCGTSIQGATKEETAASLETQSYKPPTKLNKKIWIPAIIFILLSGTAVSAFFFKKSAKSLYFISEYKSIQQQTEDWNQLYGESIEFQKETLKSPSSTKMELSGNIETGPAGAVSPETEMLQEILKEASISVQADQDPKKKASYYQTSLNIGKESVDAKLFQSEKQLGLQIPALYEKVLYLNLKEYGEFMRMMDPTYNGPEKLNLSQPNSAELLLSEKEKAYLAKRYGDFIDKELKDEHFSLEKNVKYEHKGEEMKLRKVSLQLSSEETKALLLKFLDQLIEDKKMHNMLWSRADKMIQSSMDEKLQVDSATFKEELVKGLKKTKSEIKDMKFPNGFQSDLLIDKKEQIIDRSVKITFNNEVNHVKFDIHTKNIPYDQDKRLKEIKVEAIDDKKDKVGFNITNDIDENKEKRKENLAITCLLEKDGNIDTELKFKIDSKYKGDPSEKHTVDRDFTFSIKDEDSPQISGKVAGKVKQSNDINIEKKYANQSFDIQMNFDDVDELEKINLKLDSKSKLKDVQLPSLEKDQKALNVMKLSDEDIMNIQQEVSINLYELMKKFGLMDPFEEDMNTMETETYSNL
ncbi:hypothetical protein J2S13_003106 [Oikeobacillus pervagus]|uniref:Uncharacterized protein n=1 Tax=Oikeobacillus pervagus TaxID=1325931 RepID=A0AAJ1WHV9_9BACI|nr:zinc ribbon domain-containing protein [Oikeobacillus pervagus]MDQ0216632.1 hypothetical protein [Oikeobacillus pervagus]